MNKEPLGVEEANASDEPYPELPTDWALRRGGRVGIDADDEEAELPLGMMSDALKLLNCDLITGGVSVRGNQPKLVFTCVIIFFFGIHFVPVSEDCTENYSITFLVASRKKNLPDSTLELSRTVPRAY